MKVAVLILFSALASAQTPSIQPAALECEHRAGPLGIDETAPRLSWQLAAANPRARGLKQTAYYIQAATSRESLLNSRADLWDTGKVLSEQSVLIAYQGKPLVAGLPVWWRVRVWDQAGIASAWSRIAHWSMGLLQPEDWQAKWIGHEETSVYKHPRSPFQLLRKARWIWYPEADPVRQAPPATRWFRTRVTLPKDRTIIRARFILGADNSFQLTVNGKPAGRGGVRMPEVLHLDGVMRPGTNDILVEARNAKADPAGVIGTLQIDFATGDPLVLITDSKWETAQAKGGPWTPARELGSYGIQPWGEAGFEEEHALPARMLRKEFDAASGLRRATAYVSGLGLFEIYVNGSNVGDHVLSPGLTDYEKRIFYVTLDTTKQIVAGRNAIGVILGNGRYWPPRGVVPIGTRGYGYPRLRLQLELEYTNGRKTVIGSDESWKLTTRGPTGVNNEYDGEEYDARLEMPGWSRPGFNDSAWQFAQLVQAPAGVMAAQMAEPLKVTETLAPQRISEIRPGVWIVDMGQNLVGWCRIRVAGPRGTAITLRHAETLRPDGTLYVDNLRSARATNLYILKGGGQEVWEPRFTYHGFRYVEVTGYPGRLTAANIEGRVVHDAMERAGEFECSHELLNRIHRNIYWGIRGNYRSIPTDCPQRDERQGWLGDRSVVSRSESYLFDVAAFYTKWVQDIGDSQRPSGSIPDVSPAYWVLYNDGIVWPSTFILAPQMILDQYGDLRPVERHYPAMKKWVKYMEGFLQNGIMPKNTYGDWCVPPEKPELIHSKDPARVTAGPLLSTAYYHQMLRVISRFARLTGRSADAAEFDALAARIREAFLTRWFNPREDRFDNGTQTSSVLPLAFNLVPKDRRAAVFENLVQKIEKESGNHVGVGLVGAQWLMRTLSDNGRPDVAFTIATQTTYPGWGYMIGKGATTIWELWNGDTADPAMNSGNHVMQIGDLGVWLYEYIAGIRPVPVKPGFKQIVVKPYPVAGLTHARATHRSPYGLISSAWRREGGRFTLEVSIPPNTAATVYVPSKQPSSVSEAGGLKPARSEAARAVFEAGSGSYTFTGVE